MGKYTEDLNNKLLLTEKEHYHRDQLNTFMTTCEWENVEDAQSLGSFMAERKTMFYFPFISRTINLLAITLYSIQSANKHDSLYKILTSEYGVMAGFVNFFNMLEFIPKGIVGFFVRPFITEQNATNMQNEFASYLIKYGKDLETIPFYDHDYGHIYSELAKAYQAASASGSLTLADRFTYYLLSAELRFRSILSKPLHNQFHQPENLTPATTDILVRYRSTDATDEASAKDNFMELIKGIKEQAQVEIVNQHVYVKPKLAGKGYISTYALLSAPRYRAFCNTTAILSDNKIEIKKIAGNDNVQVKCSIKASDQDALVSASAALNAVPHTKSLFEYGNSIHLYRRTSLFSVPVSGLQNAVKNLNTAHTDAEVSFIHNF